MSLNRLVLVINASYEAVNVTSARRALTLVLGGKAVVEEVSAHVVRTSRIAIPVPGVIRLTKYRRLPRLNRAVSRRGVILRDNSTCQYFRSKLPSGSRSEEHTSELQSHSDLVCRLLLEKKKKKERNMPLLNTKRQ